MHIRPCLILLWLFILAPAGIAAADAATTNADRLRSVEKLIERSSAAEMIDSNNNADVRGQREKARDLFRAASEANRRGETAEAAALLDQATAAMFLAVRMVKTGADAASKHERDYQDRYDSVGALLESYDRIAPEKGVDKESRRELDDFVRSKLGEAELLRARGDFVAGRKVLDEAYAAEKVAIERGRGGDTLVRSLNFATKEEEYRYELDRNDTHRMLINVLLEEKMEGNEATRTMVQKFLDNAGRIRGEAELQGANGNYESAVETMEKSTREIVRAIRGAGIYIPG